MGKAEKGEQKKRKRGKSYARGIITLDTGHLLLPSSRQEIKQLFSSDAPLG